MSEVRWIRCSDKTPPKYPKPHSRAEASKGIRLLVWDGIKVSIATWKFFVIGQNKSGLIGGWGWKAKNPDKIIAWMPLPEPYERKEE
jgi:hypothetical protein